MQGEKWLKMNEEDMSTILKDTSYKSREDYYKKAVNYRYMDNCDVLLATNTIFADIKNALKENINLNDIKILSYIRTYNNYQIALNMLDEHYDDILNEAKITAIKSSNCVEPIKEDDLYLLSTDGETKFFINSDIAERYIAANRSILCNIQKLLEDTYNKKHIMEILENPIENYESKYDYDEGCINECDLLDYLEELKDISFIEDALDDAYWKEYKNTPLLPSIQDVFDRQHPKNCWITPDKDNTYNYTIKVPANFNRIICDYLMDFNEYDKLESQTEFIHKLALKNDWLKDSYKYWSKEYYK